MAPATVERVLRVIDEQFSGIGSAEVTLEANPTSVESAQLAGFLAAGVNRVSIGVQALLDADLKFLGREHSAEDAIEAVRIARRLFDRVSFDLIYARPHQTTRSWREELARALDEAADHLSLYQLTIEEGTPFSAFHARGDFQTPDEDLSADLYELTQDMMSSAGLPAYEISNHARPGAESQHNLVYWRQGDYIGVGPGAHGRLTDREGSRVATRAHRAPAIWLSQVETEGHAARSETIVDRDAWFAEALMMGLRLAEPLPWRRLFQIQGSDAEPFSTQVLEDLTGEGYIEVTDQGLRATGAGRQRLNAVVGTLLSARGSEAAPDTNSGS